MENETRSTVWKLKLFMHILQSNYSLLNSLITVSQPHWPRNTRGAPNLVVEEVCVVIAGNRRSRSVSLNLQRERREIMVDRYLSMFEWLLGWWNRMQYGAWSVFLDHDFVTMSINRSSLISCNLIFFFCTDMMRVWLLIWSFYIYFYNYMFIGSFLIDIY